MVCSISATRLEWPRVVRLLPRRAKAKSGTSSIIADRTRSESDQPKRSISPWLSGAKTNMPAEPAAVPRPKTKERCSAETRRAKAARTMPKEPAATPSPTRTPEPMVSQSGVGATAVMARPAA